MAEEIDISKALEESLRTSRRLQGDQNKELDKSINLLSKINDLRDASIAKVKALNKETVNVKEIERDVQKAREKQILTAKKEQDLANSLSDVEKTRANDYVKNIENRKKLEEDIQKAKFQNNTTLQRQLGRQLNALDATIQNQENILNIDERRLASVIEANKVAGETQKILEAELAAEKEINESVGLTGKAFGFLAKKLGIGDKYYGDMVQKARDLNEENKKLSFFDKAKSLGKAAAGGIGTALSDPLTMLPLIGGAIGGIVSGFMKLVELALSAQDRTVKFGRALGMSGDSAIKVRNEFSKIAFQSNSIFINSEKLMQSQEELTGILGTNNILSGKILETNSLLKDIAGLEAETRGEIVQSSIITGKSVEATTKSVLAQVVGLQKATGIGFNFQKILKEASSLGGYLGLSFAKYPDKLTKSLITVKAMGLELKQLDSMADSFLDFESSISNEFEAQLLTGKNINLMKAREAFLNNDLAGAAAEITSQVGSSGDFLKMNRIQAESLSKAFGMSRDQLGEMLKKQELLSRIGAKDTDNAQKQLQIGLQKFGNQKALAEAVGEEAYNSMLNASAQEKIAAFMDKIKQSIADFVANSPLIPMIERAIDFLSKPSNIQKIISYVQTGFALIFDIVGKTAGVMMKLGNIFGAGISEDLISTVMAGGDSIRAMNLAGPVTVGANKVKNETSNSSNMNAPVAAIASENKMGRGNTYIYMDPITGTAVVKVTDQSSGVNQDSSPIINPGK